MGMRKFFKGIGVFGRDLVLVDLVRLLDWIRLVLIIVN